MLFFPHLDYDWRDARQGEYEELGKQMGELAADTTVEKTVRYRQFDIDVRAVPECVEKSYRIVLRLWRDNDKTQSAFSSLNFRLFDREQQAYEWGLQQARAWVDEQAPRTKNSVHGVKRSLW